MKRVMSYETLRSFTYSNDRLLQGSIKGIVLAFTGLGGQDMYNNEDDYGKRLAKNGIVYLIPYVNPWNWMNEQAVRYTDEIIAVLKEQYGFSDNIPVVAMGGSMGGQSALIYTRYAAQTPIACIVNCPVCDMVFHYGERPDLPRTMYSAYGMDDFPTLEEAIAAHSPIHLADEMPDVKYVVFHCDEDRAVDIHRHSERFVALMQKNHRIEYHVVHGRDHCQLDEKNRALYEKLPEDAILKKS